MLHRIVSAGHLRYWIICSWAVALATEVRLDWVACWFVATMALGLVRTIVDPRAARLPNAASKIVVHALATVSCIAWAGAPILAWTMGSHYGQILAVGLLCAGYMLVFTQMRSAPREALIVSAPYTMVLLYMMVSLWGTPGFQMLLTLAPVLGLSLLIKVVVTQIKDREIGNFTARQASLIEDLEGARDAANAASTAKSSFLGVISHELRTPMNGVLGAAQLLEAADLRPVHKGYVAIIRQSGETLLGLLNDILDITKIEAGKMELALTEVSMEDLQRRMIGPFKAHAEAKGLTFVASFPENAPRLIRTDPLRLVQIVHNFLGNAIKFTSQGVIRLSLVVSEASDDKTRLILTIEDEGIGIAESDLEKLFQPFSQVDASSTRRFSGTGLGLSIAKRMAELLGGEVKVRSVLGVGSAFSVALDVEVLEAAPPQVESAPVLYEPALEPAPVTLRILIAEDHPVNRMILETFLQSLNHRVTTTPDGQAAVDQAGLEVFDLIILDVNMPIMDGLKAARLIRAGQSPNRHTPIVVLSASARMEDHLSGFEAGADAYLDKPVEFAALAAVIDRARSGRRAFSQSAEMGVDRRLAG